MKLINELPLIESIEMLSNPDPYLFIRLTKEVDEFDSNKTQALYLYYKMGAPNNKSYDTEKYNFERLPEKSFLAVEKGGNYKIVLPPTFMLLYNLNFQFQFQKFITMPLLEIIIELEDIIGNKYKHEYLLEVKTLSIQKTIDKYSLKTKVNAIFDIKEKKQGNIYKTRPPIH